MTQDKQSEPWLRGTLTDMPAVHRAVLHALQAAEEDLVLWCGTLTDEEINARPSDLPSVAFHLKHIAGSLDRLLTYAEGRNLNDEQLQTLKAEALPASNTAELLQELI